MHLNWNEIESNWQAYKNEIKQHWAKLTDDQLEVIAGERDHLTGKIQVMYGVGRDEAEYQVLDWQNKQRLKPFNITNNM